MHHYEQMRKIGQTGMSVLYTAFDQQTQQGVFIKTMLENNSVDDYEAPKKSAMFEREIKLAMSLKHDNILGVINQGEMLLEGSMKRYVAYPYIEGGSLRGFLEQTPSWWRSWSLMQTADMILQAALALFYMHTRDRPIVHWDVKTDNFLIRREQGQARIAHLFLCDFGISRPQEASEYQTSGVYGTQSFMPPEQFDGYITCQSDQYSLAMMACYLLTGRYPLRASHGESWEHIHKTVQPWPPSALNHQRISIEVDHVILKALSKKHSDRYPSVWEFAKQLYSAIKQYTDPRDELPPDMRINVASTAIPAKPKHDPIPLHLPIDTDPYPIVAEPPVLQQPIARRKDALNKLPLITSQPLLGYRLAAPPQTICWSRDGEYIACLFSAHPPVIVSRTGKAKVVSGVMAGPVACWAPYGHVLAVSSHHEERGEEYSKLSIIDVQQATSRPCTMRFRAPSIEGLDWSVKGELAVWTGGATQIQLYSLSQALLSTEQIPAPQFLSTQQMTCGGVGVLRWSPDGSLIAAGGDSGQLLCWWGDTYTIHWQDSTSRWQVYSLAWSPVSTLLAVAFEDRRVAMWNIHTHRLHTAWTNLPMVPRTLSISQEGALAIASNQPYLLIGNINEPTPSAKHHGYALAEWSPTRNELATLDPNQSTKLIIWQVQQRF
jgi:serine/threonine protein kinase